MMGREHVRNIALMPGAALVALSDPVESSRAETAALAASRGLGMPRMHEHHGALLAAGGFDALVIASPNHTHHAIMVDCLATPAPILVEKPLATMVDHAWELERMARSRAAPVWVAMEYRYMPPVARLIEAGRAGEAGALKMIAIREHRFPFLDKVGGWNRHERFSGGTMVEKCCHFFDLMRLLAGAEPVRAVGSGAHDVNRLVADAHGAPADVIDNAFVIVDFANGVRGCLDLCMFAEGAWFQEEIAATGDRARVEAKVPGPARFWPGGAERASEFIVSPREPKAPLREEIHVDETVLAAGDHHGSTFYQHQRFLDICRNGGAPEVCMRDGAIAVEVGLAAEKAIRTGQPVGIDIAGR
ncbi:MAG TPA: Gfo/Idh/MocA family oxidoreductase [Rhizobiaceae bacterium]|nr:Gfo/Idh/MocA family oxidoreductase [Rhizobiaceae bacterium]